MSAWTAGALADSNGVGRYVWGRLRARVVLAVIFVSALCGWSQLAPIALRGGASYVVTDGTSMLPTLKANGIVITRAERTYEVGDIVAYRNRQLGAVVLHRIVARRGNRFVLKGDNNSFRDTFKPLAADVLGAQWVYLPNLGQTVLTLREPAVFAAIVGGLGLTIGSHGRRRRGRRRHAS